MRRRAACCVVGDARRSKESGQGKGRNSEGEELCTQQNALGMEAGTLQEQVFDGLRDGPAPGAVGVGRQAEAV